MRTFTVNETTNYDIFDLHENNRVVKTNSKKFKNLMLSIKKHGFLPFYPIWVKKNENGKLSVQAGHNRLKACTQLGVPLFYMVYNAEFKIWEEETSTKVWALSDHLTRLITEGDHNALAIKNYHEETGIGLSVCLSIFSNETTSKSNKTQKFKEGNFKILPSTFHKADIIKEIVFTTKLFDKYIATHPHYVTAISKAMCVKSFNPEHYMSKLKRHTFLLTKQPDTDHYLELVDSIYNRQSQQSQRIPLAFLARQEMKKRKTFGH